MTKNDTPDSTADQRIPIHVKKTHVKRVFALAEISPSLTVQSIFDAALTIGLKRLEGGDS